MKRKILWPILTLIVLLLVIIVATNIKFDEVVVDFPGRYVDEFVIQDNKTFPQIISDEIVAVEVNISVQKVFSRYKINGNLKIEGTTYKILSWDHSSSGFVAAISTAPLENTGIFMMSEDLRYYSIQLNKKKLIVGPAESIESAEEAVHILYGG